MNPRIHNTAMKMGVDGPKSQARVSCRPYLLAKWPTAGFGVRVPWPGFDRTIVPSPLPGLLVICGGDPGLKPGATIHAPSRGGVRGYETSRP